MTNSDKENLERKLEHVISLGEMVCEQYVHITCTERSALLLSLYSAVKQTSKNVAVVRDYLMKFILDIFRVDYDEYARRFKMLLVEMEKIAGAPMVVNIDNSVKPVVGTENILEHEEEHFNLTDEGRLTRLRYVRRYLIDNARNIYEQIEDYMKLIIADLEGISKDYYNLKGDEKRCEELYMNLKKMYLEANGDDVIADLQEELEYYMHRHGWSSASIERFGNRIKDKCDMLTNDYIDGWSPAWGLLGRRDVLTWEDLYKHFRNMEWLRILDEMKEKIHENEKCGMYEKNQGDTVIVNLGKYIEKQIINTYE